MMRITLISPRIAIQKGDFLGSGIPYWPVDLTILAAFLREKESDVSLIDLFGASPTTLEDMGDHYLQGKSFKNLMSIPSITHADIFILYALSIMSHKEILSIARMIKSSKPNATVTVLENTQAVTGYAIPQLADDFFESNVDALLCGEIYWNWEEVSAFLKHQKEADVPENVLVQKPPPGHSLCRKTNKRPSYSIPAWDLLNLENYWSLPYSHGPKTKKYFPILTSRGCPYPCDFCVIPETNNRRWRGRSPEEVVNEMVYLRDTFGVYHFQIEDLNPTISGRRWERICQLLIERKAGVFFYFASGTKAETIKIDQIPLYAEAGCRYISVSPESGSLYVLKTMGKSFNYTHGLELVKQCHHYGIYTQACFLVGHPSEKGEDHQLSCKYVRSMVKAGLDEIAVFGIAPLAGSLLYREERVKHTSEALMSFSPKGRPDWRSLSRRRMDLIKIFFIEKLKRGPNLWIQGVRALLGIPRTKMENLPRRILFVYSLILRYWLRRIFK